MSIDSLAPPEQRSIDGVIIARHLMESFAESCVWGSDWPHPNRTHIPDDGLLVDALSEIAPTPALPERLMVTIPQKL